MTTDPERFRLSASEHERIFRTAVVPDLTTGLHPTERPSAIVLGGQPGAGKSALQGAAERELASQGGVLAIVGDDLRAYHPKYQELRQTDDRTAAFYTDRDSGLWVEKLIDHASSQRLSLVIEGTMRLPDKVSQTLTTLRARGYSTDVRAVAVNERLSKLGIHQRYEEMLATKGRGRFTLAKSHEDAYRGLPVTLEQLEHRKLADRVAVYARGNRVLYENTLRLGEWTQLPAARQALEHEHHRAWTPAEKVMYAQGWDRVVSRMRSRRAHRDELDNAVLERGQAHLQLQQDPDARDLLTGRRELVSRP